MSITTVNFFEDHIKQIFSLACEGRHLKERITREFVRLSSQEVLFHTQAQSIGHESLASGHPDRFTTYYEILQSSQQSSEAKNKAMEEILDQVSKAWLATNAMLFKHILDYEAKLEKFLNKTGGWIREQEECIWTKMFEITGKAGTPLSTSLNVMLCLLDTLPSFLANLSYQSNSPIICGFAPEAYAQPWLGLHGMDLACLPSFKNHKKAKDVLKEAIIQSMGGGTVSRASAGLSSSTSTQPTQTEKDTHAPPLSSSSVVHSPSKCRHTKSPSLQHLQSDSSSDEESASGHESKSSHSSSSGLSGSSSGSISDSGSHEGSPTRSEASAGTRSVRSQSGLVGSIEVLSGEASGGDGDEDSLYSPNEGDVSQGTVSLLDISVSDDEDTRKCKAREVARKNNTDFVVWKDKLISEEMMGLQEWDNVVNDYADGKRRPKNPDSFVPPVSYMEEHGVFKPLPSTTNPLGLCHFYPTDPTIVPTLTAPKLPAKLDHIRSLLILAKTQPCPYIIIVFPGGAITALGLLQELQSRSALARIPIYRPDETKEGHRPCISCCPFCAYTVQNDPAYLNHIVSMHYNVNFACGTCLGAVTSSCQQMKRHLNECKGLDPPMPPSSQGSAAPPTTLQESARSGHSPKKSSQGSKHAGRKRKNHHSGKSWPAISVAQEDSQGTDRCVTHATGTSQESTVKSMRRQSQRKKKLKSHKKDKSSKWSNAHIHVQLRCSSLHSIVHIK